MVKINKKSFTRERNKGDTLMETLFYIAIFAILSIAVINSMITMMKSFKETAIQRELAQGANIMERVSREIRADFDVNSITGTGGNDIVLNAGSGKTMELKLFNNNIQIIDNGASALNLNPSNIVVSALTFTQITTTKGKAVKVALTIYSNHDASSRTENFYDTVVLRGDY